jgi:hypothetical protein
MKTILNKNNILKKGREKVSDKLVVQAKKMK